MLNDTIRILSENALLTYAIVFTLSACIGSFLNVLILRLPVILAASDRDEVTAYLTYKGVIHDPIEEAMSLPPTIMGRSVCPSCKSNIPGWLNIPIISYLFLLGQSACCKSTISIRYPIVEALTACLSLLFVCTFGISWATFYILPFIWISIALVQIDFDTQLLPDVLVFPLLWGGLLYNGIWHSDQIMHSIYGAITGYILFAIADFIFRKISPTFSIGNGDHKLLSATGAWIGLPSIPNALVLACAFAVIQYLAFKIFSKSSQSRLIPFGPAIICAGWYMFIYNSLIAV